MIIIHYNNHNSKQWHRFRVSRVPTNTDARLWQGALLPGSGTVIDTDGKIKLRS